MKRIISLSIFFLFLIPIFAQPDPACTQMGCATDIVNISTGYDHANQQPYPTGAYDAFWTLVESPDPGISVPRPAFVLPQISAWDLIANTAYISAYPDPALNANNSEPDPPYGFETCFCICGDNSEVTIDLSAHADNNVDIYLKQENGGFIQQLLAITATNTSAFQDPPEMSTNTVSLNAGNYCIRADLRNLSSGAMGLDIQGTIAGASLIETLCCNPNSSITGMKYHDVNCNGQRDNGEPGLQGWEIVLCEPSGQPVTSIITDEQGFYTFIDVPPGNYLVKENLQQGWTPSDPISGFHQIDLGQAQVIADLDFGNCESTEGCEIMTCQTDQLIINTGYDPSTGTTGAVGSYDGYWTVCETPDTNLSVPRPAFLLNPHPAWANQANTAWLSPFPSANFNQNNPAPDPPYGFKYCFCVCNETEVTIDLSALADNNVDINLTDETGLNVIAPLLSITDQTTGAFQLPATTSSNTIGLGMGTYCIRADLRNLSSTAMGLNIMGMLSGGNLIESLCCDNTGSITGIKYNDLNCNGQQDSNEPGLPDWEISLCDQAGNPITSAMTDAAGYYTFPDLDPGTYTVKEVQQPRWSQSQPANGGNYTIGLLPKGVQANVDFGNCEISCSPCPDNIVVNGGFEEGAGGGAFPTGWAANTGSPQVAGNDFCEDPVSMQMWGNRDVGEAIIQTGVGFQANTTYRISFCARFLPQPNLTTNYVQLGFTASNGSINPFNNANAYNIGSTGIGEVTEPEWMCFTLDDWTPSQNYSDLIINCFNNTPNVSGDATTVSWGRIDNICITEVACEALWEFELEGECGTYVFIDQSTGNNLTYCWDFDGDLSTCESTLQNPAYTFPAPGTYTVCLTVAGGMDCEDTFCQEINVDFNQDPPTIECPANATIECDELPANIDPVVTNSPCAEELAVNCVRSDGQQINAPYPPCETVTLTCTATNEFGSNSCSFQVTTVDNTPPVAICIANLTVVVDDSCQASIHAGDIDNMSTDNCGIVSRSLDKDFFTPDESCQEVQVSLTVTDCGGNTGQCTTVVFVQDNTPPAISCPANTQVECDTESDPSNTGFPSGNDNCPGELSFSFNDEINGLLPCDAVVTRTWTAIDGCDNSSTCTQTIVVADQTAPTIECPSDLSVNTNEGRCFATLDLPAPVVSDNCDLDPTFTCLLFNGTGFDPISPETQFAKGENTIRCRATDACNNVGTSCTFVLTVEDNEPPILSDCPTNISVNVPFGNDGGNVTWTLPTASDNCPDPVLNCSHQPGDFFPCGNSEVICTVADCGGNEVSCQFVVTVICGEDPCDSLEFDWSFDNSQPPLGNCCWNVSLDQQIDDTSVKSISLSNAIGADISVFANGGWNVNQTGNNAEITFPGGGPVPQGNYADQFKVCFENKVALPQSIDLFWNIVDPNNPDSCILVCPETIFSDCEIDCTCGGFTDIVLQKGNANYPLTCGGNPADIGCPINNFTLSGQFNCEGSCDPSNLSWTLARPDGTTLNGTFGGATWNIGFATNDIDQTGIYTLDLIGSCDGNECTCSVTWIQTGCTCPNNLVQNGEFSLGVPTSSDQDIGNATNWSSIWSGGSTADFYNTVAPQSPGVLTSPLPLPQGNYGGMWCRNSADAVWREGMMNQLSTTIDRGSGCYDLSMKIACMFDVFGTPSVCIYGLEVGATSTGTPGATTPLNTGLFSPAGSVVELGCYAIPADCDNNFQTISFQFDSDDLPAGGIDRIFITRQDNMPGGTFLGIDDVCLEAGVCPDPCCTNFEGFCDRVNAGFTWSVDPDSCKMTVAPKNFTDCMEVTEWIWDDGTNGGQPNADGSYCHYYGQGGAYTICFVAVERDASGEVCWEKEFCETIEFDCPSGCDSLDQECLTDMLDISTGIDHLTGGSYTSARYDAFWTLVETEAAVSVPRPATVISPHLVAGWGFQNGAEWISFYDDYNLTENNEVPDPPHAFERCFCLCSEEAEVTFDLSVLADDIVDINLFDGSGLVTNLLTLDNTTSPNFDNPPTPVSVTVPLTAGNYCIRADARNTDQVAFGFNMQGTLLGGVFQKAECCRQGNIIYGVVYHDKDQNNFRNFRFNADPPEPGLNGWTVQLTDLGGTPLFNTTTDQYGYYEFVNVPAGSYLLKEIVMTQWVQTEPATVEYTVNIGAQDVAANLNFGNYMMVNTTEMAYLGDIELFPNPAEGFISLSFSLPSAKPLHLRLTDLWGRTISTSALDKGETLHTLDIGQLPSAVYLLSLTDEEGRAWHSKFVKQ